MQEELREKFARTVLPRFQDALLEREFRDYLFDTRHRLIRNCLLIALGIFIVLEPVAAIWAPVDPPDVDAWSRWLVDVPALLFALLAVQRSDNRALQELSLVACLGVVLATNALSLWFAHPDIRPFYAVASIQIMLFGFMLVGLRFRQAFFCISLVFGLAMLVSSFQALFFESFPDYTTSYAMPALVYLGLAFSAYFLDLAARNVFLLDRIVAQTHARQLELERERNSWLRVGSDYLNHEIKNAMLGISSSLSLLQRRNRDKELADYIERAGQSTAFMKRLLGEVSVSTNLEAVLASLEPERVELCNLLQAKLLEYQEIYPDNDFELRSGAAVFVDCDVDRIVQALDKLVDNAAAHTVGDVPIRLTLESSGSEAVVAVTNIGEPLVDAGPELFDPFVTRRSRSADGGLGLGLYVVKRIVEAHGGTVTCAALENPDGAVFRLALPLSAA